MRRFLTALAAVAACWSACAMAEPRRSQPLTAERIVSDPALSGPLVRSPAFSPDGAMVTFLRPKRDDQQRLDLWAMDARTGRTRLLVDSRALAATEAGLSEAEIARRERRRITAGGVVEYAWDSRGEAILAPVAGDLFLADPRTGSVRRLTDTDADELNGKISPRGGFVSFVRDQNLYALDLRTAVERALTTDGGGAISNGVADFILQEEFAQYDGHWWSPDDRKLAFFRVDETAVPLVQRFAIEPEGVRVAEQRYAFAGAANALIDLFVLDLASGRSIAVDLGPERDIYVVRVAWAADGRTLYVQRLNRSQTRLELLAVDPDTGRARVLVAEEDEAWVNVRDDFAPLQDGRFVWASEASGYRHLYLHGADGARVRPLTAGDWPIRSLAGVDEKAGLVFFEASIDTPLETHLYAAPLAGGPARRVTDGAGVWSVEMARGGGAFLGTYSDPATPPRTGLYRADGRRIAWVEDNDLDQDHPFAPYAHRYPAPEFGTLTAADGATTLHYRVLRPVGFDPGKRHPAIVHVYGGPTVQLVRRDWVRPELRLFQERGYVVFEVDNRGSAGRGRAFEKSLAGGLGTVEVDDQYAGLRWLKAQPYVDPERIGVTGWSYGGTMTLLLLLREPTAFAAGAAGAPVTDWRLYDTGYTERYLRKPADAKAAYDRAAVTQLAGRLERPLLLAHGMADDNVVFTNSTALMAALQAAHKPFELMTYPGEPHGLRMRSSRRHYLETRLAFFERTLAAQP